MRHLEKFWFVFLTKLGNVGNLEPLGRSLVVLRTELDFFTIYPHFLCAKVSQVNLVVINSLLFLAESTEKIGLGSILLLLGLL